MKPLPSQNTFAPLAPPWSLQALDTNFTDVWNAVNDFGTYSLLLQDVGNVNALAANLPSGITATYFAGLTVDIVAANTSTSTTPTLNVGGLGAATIITQDGVALLVGQIIAGSYYRMIYDGVNWRLLNPSLLTNNYREILVHKPATTSRSAVTVPANDPDLALLVTFPGTYTFEVLFAIYQSVGSSMGLTCNVNFSGSYTAGASFQAFGFFLWQGGTAPAPQVASSPSVISFNLGNAMSTSAASPSSGIIKGFLTATSAGVLSFAWAQATSNAGALNLIAGSNMKMQLT